jgi:hypothetical protein
MSSTKVRSQRPVLSGSTAGSDEDLVQVKSGTTLGIRRFVITAFCMKLRVCLSRLGPSNLVSRRMPLKHWLSCSDVCFPFV